MDKDANDLDGDCSRPQKHAKSPELAREFLLDAATVIFKEQACRLQPLWVVLSCQFAFVALFCLYDNSIARRNFIKHEGYYYQLDTLQGKTN